MEKAMKTIDEKMKRVEEEKIQMELQLADIADGHNINAQATRLKMNKIKKYAPEMKKNLQFAWGSIVVLLAILIAMSDSF